MYSLAQLDRTIYEHLRLEIVKAGYLPDITLFTDGEGWQAARDTLRAALVGNELIDVFGVGAADERGEWTGAKIVINRTTEASGTIGAGLSVYKRIVGGFEKTQLPQTTTNITYEVIVTATGVRTERIMSEIVSRAFGRMKHIGVFNNDGTISNEDKVFIRQTQKFDQSSLYFLQKNITFTLQDLFLLTETTEEMNGNIAQINSINFTIYAATKSDVIKSQSAELTVTAQ
jgi:hypothetical protein